MDGMITLTGYKPFSRADTPGQYAIWGGGYTRHHRELLTWVPKSVTKIDGDTIMIPTWLEKKKGLLERTPLAPIPAGAE